MKKLISSLLAAAVTAGMMPGIMAAENKPVISYDFESTAGITLNGGAALGEGKTGKGLVLDGVDGYALLPENIVSDNMTITAWLKLSKLNTWGRLFDFGNDSNNNFFFAPFSGGAARVESKISGTAETMDCTEDTDKDKWVHYAVTAGGGTMSLYRNGRLVNTKSGVNQSLSELKNTLNYIGKSHYDGDGYLAGTVDDFNVYDSVLSETEIQSIMGSSISKDDLETLLDAYSIEDGQLVLGNKIELPKLSGECVIGWKSSSGAVNTETGEVKHSGEAQTVTLTQTAYLSPGNTAAVTEQASREYTVYIPAENEAPYTIDIDVSDRSKPIADTMWGLFFEDINSAADGGLYAELVQNGSFEYPDSLYSWTAGNAEVEVKTDDPLNENNTHYISYTPKADDSYIENDGYLGMSVKKDGKYDVSLYTSSGSYEFIIQLVDNDGNVIGEGISERVSGNVNTNDSTADTAYSWEKIGATIDVTADSDNARLRIYSPAPVELDMISLMPQDTYKGHGLRRDLMEKLEEMHPKFLRFPGGCAVEGRTMDLAWNWKDTIGDISERKPMENIWNTGSEPYIMSYGLGFYEYFQMCEDLGMEPVPILNCGMACQVRSGSSKEEKYLVPMDKLQPYIDDALDLIEFANGTDENNEWVKKRIEMGHPEPFGLKYIGIGNEQYGEIYFERYAEFAKQIHEKYPNINLITTSGTASSGASNDLAWNWADENTEYADLMDEHYYESADWFRSHAYRYDNYRRGGTNVFLGEYASKGNTWYNALSEAAFMTGLERNADVVKMASYAPMFAKYGNTQWSAADMIWFNNSDYVLTPNYYIQSLFSNNQGDYSLPTDVELNGIENDDTFRGGIVVGSWGTHNEFKDISVVSTGTGIEKSVNPKDGEWIFGGGEWSVNDEGALVQSSDETASTAFIDSPGANRYTLCLKAKKTAGSEGFQIGVAAEDELNYYRVNIGGWSNTTAKIQHIVNGVSAEVGNVAEQSYVGDVHINDGEWYDVTVEVSDYEIKAYLNDEFICSYTKPKEYGPVYSSSVFDEETGDIIIKLANLHDADAKAKINLNNAQYVGSKISVTTMQGGDGDVNTLENKNVIIPVEGTADIEVKNNELGQPYFEYSMPENSFTLLRISTNKGSVTLDGDTIVANPIDNGAHLVIAVNYDENGIIKKVYASETVTGDVITLPVSDAQGKLKVYMFDKDGSTAAAAVINK